MNKIDKAFNFTLDYLKNLSLKDNFNVEEKDYIDYAPKAVLCNRFNYEKDILNDAYFVYPILCAIEKAVGELTSRVKPGAEYFNEKIILLIKMHPDVDVTDQESDAIILSKKINDIDIRNLFNFLYQIKKLRNDVFHLRFENLKYQSNLISNYKVRATLLKDLFEFNKHWDQFRVIALRSGRLPYEDIK